MSKAWDELGDLGAYDLDLCACDHWLDDHDPGSYACNLCPCGHYEAAAVPPETPRHADVGYVGDAAYDAIQQRLGEHPTESGPPETP